jgi:hypothetical protein
VFLRGALEFMENAPEPDWNSVCAILRIRVEQRAKPRRGSSGGSAGLQAREKAC